MQRSLLATAIILSLSACDGDGGTSIDSADIITSDDGITITVPGADDDSGTVVEGTGSASDDGTGTADGSIIGDDAGSATSDGGESGSGTSGPGGGISDDAGSATSDGGESSGAGGGGISDDAGSATSDGGESSDAGGGGISDDAGSSTSDGGESSGASDSDGGGAGSGGGAISDDAGSSTSDGGAGSGASDSDGGVSDDAGSSTSDGGAGSGASDSDGGISDDAGSSSSDGGVTSDAAVAGVAQSTFSSSDAPAESLTTDTGGRITDAGVFASDNSGSSLIRRSALTATSSQENICTSLSDQNNFSDTRIGDFILHNNAWRPFRAFPGYEWEQCINTNTNGNIVGWTYDWGPGQTGINGATSASGDFFVRSYPELIFGVKDEFRTSAPKSVTGLPVVLSDLPNIQIDYSYDGPQFGESRTVDASNNPRFPNGTTISGERNVAVESFMYEPDAAGNLSLIHI